MFVGDRFIQGNFESLVGIGETPHGMAISKARREAAGKGEPKWKTKPLALGGRRILVVAVVLFLVAVVTVTLDRGG